jgi:glycosyltransferase involved in cell wall biosynthesis
MSANFLSDVTAVVLTYNEAPNIDRVLAKLDGCRRIVVIDSGSDDGTQDIVAKHANAEVVFHPFENFADQCNFALAQSRVDTEWVLTLDADYVLSDELVVELAALTPSEDVAGYRARFRYSVFGHALRSGVYPAVVVLFRRARARYVPDGHAHRVVVDGKIEELTGCVYHDDRKSLSRWFDSQKAYARREAEHLELGAHGTLRWQDRIRLMAGLAPPLMFAYVYLIRGGFLDGRPGLYYALQRAYAELVLSLELLDRRLRRGADS